MGPDGCGNCWWDLGASQLRVGGSCLGTELPGGFLRKKGVGSWRWCARRLGVVFLLLGNREQQPLELLLLGAIAPGAGLEICVGACAVPAAGAERSQEAGKKLN